jgi:hypothetical protein
LRRPVQADQGLDLDVEATCSAALAACPDLLRVNGSVRLAAVDLITGSVGDDVWPWSAKPRSAGRGRDAVFSAPSGLYGTIGAT